MAHQSACADPSSLPIISHRDTIMATIRKEDCSICIGETGSGKTTKLPQLLLEAGFQRVCVTQPRRVAAIAAARRVAEEMDCAVGSNVGYAVRFEQKQCSQTRIMFVTDGVLLRQAVSDPDLKQYDALVLDEAHERSLNTDVIFALAKRVLTRRRGASGRSTSSEDPSSHADAPGLRRVVIASATLDAEKLKAYFFGCPVLRIPGRCFPVTVMHAAEPTPYNSRVEAALELILRVHVQRARSPAEHSEYIWHGTRVTDTAHAFGTHCPLPVLPRSPRLLHWPG